MRAVQEGTDDRDLLIRVTKGCIMVPSCLLLVCVGYSATIAMLLSKIGFKALLAIAEKKLLPLTVKWLTKLH